MENKKELIWEDTNTIESLSKQAENIIITLNDNYSKMKEIDSCLNYTTVIAATFFRCRNLQWRDDYKQERKELIDSITAVIKSQTTFAPSDMIDSYITKDLFHKLYYNEYINNTYEIGNPEHENNKKKDIQTIRHDDDNDYILEYITFNSAKDNFEISDKFKDAIAEKNTYCIKNSNQAKKYKALQQVEQILNSNDMTTQDLCHILYADDQHIDIDFDLVKWLYQY